MKKQIGFVCFGEVNTPIERLRMKHDEALAVLQERGYELQDAGLVIDDPAYETADAAAQKLKGFDMACLVVCVAGWIPTHAVIRGRTAGSSRRRSRLVQLPCVQHLKRLDTASSICIT